MYVYIYMMRHILVKILNSKDKEKNLILSV